MPCKLGELEPHRVLGRMDAFEKHYTPVELAKLWSLSPRFVRDMFRDENGVMLIDRPEKMHKRGYCTLRIPASVAKRVRDRLVSK